MEVMKFSGETAQFYLSSGLGEPTTLNILDSIGQPVISGLPVAFHTGSGVYWTEYTFHDDFASGLYWTEWNPIEYYISGLDRVFIFRNDRYRISHAHGRQGFNRIIPQPMSTFYHCADSGLIPSVTTADYWLFDYYTFTGSETNIVKQYYPNAKVGVSIPVEVDQRWVEDLYEPYALLSGATDTQSWINYFDYELCRLSGLDFYLLSGVQNSAYSDWAAYQNKPIFAMSNSVVTGYDNLVYSVSDMLTASKITASGIYLFTDNLYIAGRQGCGYFGIVEDYGDLELRSFNETRYSNGISVYTLFPTPTSFSSMVNDTREYDYLSTLTVSGYVGLTNYWRTSQETSYLSSFSGLKTEALSFNASTKFGVELYYTDWPSTVWEAEYTSGLDTFGTFMYPTMSGITDPTSTSYRTMWSYVIENMGLSFFIVPDVGDTHRAWLNSTYGADTELIYRGDSNKHIITTGLSLAQTESLVNQGKYVWTDNFDIAAYLSQGYSEHGVRL